LDTHIFAYGACSIPGQLSKRVADETGETPSNEVYGFSPINYMGNIPLG